MKTFLFTCALLILLKSKCQCKVVVSEEIPDILDLLPKPALNSSSNRRSYVEKNDMLFDLDNIDETQFRKNVELLKKQLTNLNNNVTIENSNTGMTLLPHRRANNLGYLTSKFINPGYTTTIDKAWKYGKGIKTHIMSLKISDLMLQFVYMARHKLMELDAQTIVKPKAENYRQVFLYKHLVRLSDKLWDVHQIIRNHTRFELNYISDEWRSFSSMMRLHQLAVKLYVDFSYFWWVFMRIHERFIERTQVLITRPPSTEFTYRSTTASVPINLIVNTDYPSTFAKYSTPINTRNSEFYRTSEPGFFFG